MKVSEKDLEKMMAFVMEHKAMITSMLKVINEDTTAGTECSSDGIKNTESMDGEGTEAIISEECEDDDEVEITEGDAEKADTETSSDGVDYPDVGDGTGVEGETLKEEDCCDDEEEVEELNEEGGTASAPAGGGAPGVSNVTGIARVKAPLGKKVGEEGSNVTRRYDESAREETADDVKAMMESWKTKSHWVNLY